MLASAARQTRRPDEIWIADDGSSDGTGEVLAAFRAAHPDLPLGHLWHEDRGFRKTLGLNRAFRRMTTPYAIVVDGDMILDRRFVENHLRHRAPDRVLCGYRGVKLGPALSRALIEGRRAPPAGLAELLALGLRGELAHASRAMRVHAPALRRLLRSRRRHVSGCNFSLDRSAIERVNGMDETIQGYGYEDLELGRRLEASGVAIVDVSRCANTFHLHHPRREPTPEVRAIRERLRSSRHTRCRHGLVALEAGTTDADWRRPA